jgi:putative ATP-binding cassette transporter
MKLLLFLVRRSWQLAMGALVAGAASGLCAVALIALINKALHQPATETMLVWAFAVLVVIRVLTAAAAQIVGDRFSQHVFIGLCQDLGRRLLGVPVPRLEAIGMPRMLVTLTEDVSVIAWGIQGLPGLAINLAILLGCAVYLGWLSWAVFLGVAALALAGTVTFLLLLRSAQAEWREMWLHRERLIGYLRALIDGMKELKLNAPRRVAFLSSCLGDALEAVRRSSLRGGVRHASARGLSQMLFFLLVGILVFAMPSLHAGGAEILTGYLLVVIYMMTPLWNVIDGWPAIAQGSLAVERVMELTSLFSSQPLPAAAPRAGLEWEQLQLKGVVFTYPDHDGNRPFQLGPLDFSLRPGEVVFVAGGNGSGKSTFAKVLTGLYPPGAGEIRLDGHLVSESTREWYHSHFSAIFSDFYLFDRLLGLSGPDLDARARDYLARLELEGKVQVRNGLLSTTALSSGQRKRLALLTSLLEDRPIYVFDEWAADQDAHFRDVFYTVLIPELRRKGKGVIVISHDDRYYRLGDRTLRLADGQMSP